MAGKEFHSDDLFQGSTLDHSGDEASFSGCGRKLFAIILQRFDGLTLGFVDYDKPLLVGGISCGTTLNFACSERDTDSSSSCNFSISGWHHDLQFSWDERDNFSSARSLSSSSTFSFSGTDYVRDPFFIASCGLVEGSAGLSSWVGAHVRLYCGFLDKDGGDWFAPPSCLGHGKLSSLISDETGYIKFETSSLHSLDDLNAGRVYQRHCDADLFDLRCGLKANDARYNFFAQALDTTDLLDYPDSWRNSLESKRLLLIYNNDVESSSKLALSNWSKLSKKDHLIHGNAELFADSSLSNLAEVSRVDNLSSVSSSGKSGDMVSGGLRYFISGIDSAVCGYKVSDGLGNDEKKTASFTAVTTSRPMILGRFYPYIKLTSGCDKTLETCCSRFDNAVSFRGFPHIPGNSYMYQYKRG